MTAEDERLLNAWKKKEILKRIMSLDREGHTWKPGLEKTKKKTKLLELFEDQDLFWWIWHLVNLEGNQILPE